MDEPLIENERALTALVEAVETYVTDARPATFDALEAALSDAKRVLGKGVD